VSIDLPFHRAWLDDDEINEVVETLKSGWLTTGPRARRFEEDFQDYIGCCHAVGLNSCTAGLHLAVNAMGFKEGSEVITTPMTFPATSNVLVHEKLKPVFVDIEPGTLNLNAEKIEEKITSRTCAILPVHFSGHPCDMDVIDAIARKNNLRIIEDAAHAVESVYKGKKIGNLGNPTAFSFYANKNMTTGEGGMLTTNDEDLADRFRVLRLHGLSRDAWKRFGKKGYSHWELHEPGWKYNMADINAALGIHQLKKIDFFLRKRKEIAKLYDDSFKNIPEIELLETRDYAENAHYLYVIALHLEQLTVSRDELLDAIQGTGIGVGVHYVPLHLHSFYQKITDVSPEDLPVATDYGHRIISLPLYPKMSTKDVSRVINAVSDLIAKYRR